MGRKLVDPLVDASWNALMNVLVIHINGSPELPANENVPNRVLELLDLDVTIYGVDPEV
ncbi:hypothetical protein ACFFQF_31845 [Haladaptatus pallidirubidus]|uniref:hypothetical protein n=1 Tax=Haladaptatus pallidirubidus TaxID=1008152 RepID=UPI001D11F1F9|nr:hypothetical protein [Haladaptatus pallidirubidus]